MWRELQGHGGLSHLAAGQIAVPDYLSALVGERSGPAGPGRPGIVARGRRDRRDVRGGAGPASGVDPSRSAADVYRALAAATAQGLVEAVPGAMGQYRFAHARPGRPCWRRWIRTSGRRPTPPSLSLSRGEPTRPIRRCCQSWPTTSRWRSVSGWRSGPPSTWRSRPSWRRPAWPTPTPPACSTGRRRHGRRSNTTGSSSGPRGRTPLPDTTVGPGPGPSRCHRRRPRGPARGGGRYEEVSYLGVQAGRAMEVLGGALEDTSLGDPTRCRCSATRGAGRALGSRPTSPRAMLSWIGPCRGPEAIADERLLLAVLTRCLTMTIKLTAEGGSDRMRRQRELADEVTALAQRRGELRPLGLASRCGPSPATSSVTPSSWTQAWRCSCRPAGSPRSACPLAGNLADDHPTPPPL